MTKKIKILFFTLLVTIISTFIGCTNIGNSPSDNPIDDPIVNPIIPTNLDSPENVNVILNDEIILVTFNHVENASSYTIKVFTSLKVQVNKVKVSNEEREVRFPLSNYQSGRYYVTVSAAGDGTYYYDSMPSTKTYFEIEEETLDPIKLDAPLNVKTTLDNSVLTISYGSVSNATGYTIYIKSSDGKEVVKEDVANDVLTKTYNVNAYVDGVYKVSVVALGDGTIYENSDLSSEVSFEVKSGGGQGGYSDITELSSYYKSVEGLTGSALKSKLRTLISTTHKKITSYNDCKKNLPNVDEDPNNSKNMILFYTGESIKKSTDLNNDWNREHVWCQSLGWFSTSGAGSDLHHIRPCDIKVNSSRGNKKYGVGSGYYTPTDEYKGDVARIIFYLMVRYSESDSYSFTSIAQSKELLLEWNELDPVSTLEKNRNEAVYKIQGNRNPFIDYPKFAEMIWK